eukprot:jgi/Botrbrau1/9003/Bobra.0148s0106.1
MGGAALFYLPTPPTDSRTHESCISRIFPSRYPVSLCRFSQKQQRISFLKSHVCVRSMAGRFEETSYAEYYDYDSTRGRSREDGMKAYEDLKELLRRRTQRFGVGFAAYLFLTVSGEAALAALLGTAASLAYLTWLMRDVDAINEDSEVPLMAARQVEQQPLRTVAIGFAAYRHALQPRLLMLILLGAGVGAYNNFAADPLPPVVDLSLFVGFLSYKVALLLVMWDDLKPKFDPNLLSRPQRPQLPVLDDVEPLDLRPKAKEPETQQPATDKSL